MISGEGMQKISIILLIILLTGCSTSGNLYSRQLNPSRIDEISTVAIKLNPGLNYWWGPWEPDLKDRVANELGRRLTRAGFLVIKENADIVLLINKINTGGWTGGIVITEIEIIALQKGKELFKVIYTQHGDSFTWRSFFRPSKLEDEVSKVLAKEIVKKIRGL